jgi:hypothetical protein
MPESATVTPHAQRLGREHLHGGRRGPREAVRASSSRCVLLAR